VFFDAMGFARPVLAAMPPDAGETQALKLLLAFPGIANLTLDNYGEESYPDGRMFDVISNGKGNMGGYKHNIPLYDRWAVVGYIRALQVSRKAPLSEDSVRQAYDAAIASGDLVLPEEQPEIPAADPAPGGGTIKLPDEVSPDAGASDEEPVEQ